MWLFSFFFSSFFSSLLETVNNLPHIQAENKQISDNSITLKILGKGSQHSCQNEDCKRELQRCFPVQFSPAQFSFCSLYLSHCHRVTKTPLTNIVIVIDSTAQLQSSHVYTTNPPLHHETQIVNSYKTPHIIYYKAHLPLE